MAERQRSSWMPWADAPPPAAPARQPRSCETCSHFQANTINPSASVGLCGIGHGTHYPMQRHWCGDHKAKERSNG